MAKGDHIKVARTTITHHGIDLGDGRVIHYSGESWNAGDASIRIDTKKAFAAGGKIQVVKYKRSHNPETIVKRAKSRLGERKYNFFTNNCEHFATWCKTGDHHSHQVSKGTRSVTTHAGTMVGLVGTEVTKAVINSSSKEAAKVAAKQTAANGFKSIARSSGPVALAFGAAEQIHDTIQYCKGNIDGNEFVESTVGNVGGTGGALAGAAIGSAIFPGVGTVLGGLLGGIFGGLGGRAVGKGLT